MNTSRLYIRPFSHVSPFVIRNVGRYYQPSTLRQIRLQSTSSNSLPKLAQSSIWTSLIPKFLRNREPKSRAATKSKEWNPASFFIIIFTLIGSQAIRMIVLKNDYAAYSRTTDAKIELLREVIEKIKKGEKVDVERLLGTGDEAKEREWEEVLREIEAEDSLWHRKSTESEPTQQSQAEQKHEVKSTEDETQRPSRPPRAVNFF